MTTTAQFDCPNCGAHLNVTATAAPVASEPAASYGDLMTKEEAAAFLRIPVNTLSHWLATNQAPRNAKIGKRRMFFKADLERFVDAKFGVES